MPSEQLVDTIRSMARKKNMSLPDLEKALRLGNGTITRWKKSSPSAVNLEKIAEYFSVTTDYLLGREEIPIALSSPTGYDNLSDAQKEQIDSFIEMLNKTNRK